MCVGKQKNKALIAIFGTHVNPCQINKFSGIFQLNQTNKSQSFKSVANLVFPLWAFEIQVRGLNLHRMDNSFIKNQLLIAVLKQIKSCVIIKFEIYGGLIKPNKQYGKALNIH